MYVVHGIDMLGETYEWIGYGMELPQLARTFFNHSVTGYDLPVLLENDGQVMQEEVNYYVGMLTFLYHMIMPSCHYWVIMLVMLLS